MPKRGNKQPAKGKAAKHRKVIDETSSGESGVIEAEDSVPIYQEQQKLPCIYPKDTEFKDYMNNIQVYLETGFYPDGLPNNAKRTIRKAVATGNYLLEGKTLFYQGTSSGRKLRVITDQEDREKILWHNHSASTASHCGVNTTVKKISEHYWWKGMQADIANYIVHCDVCRDHKKIQTQASEVRSVKVHEPLHKVKEPLHTVGMHFYDPMVETRAGHSYVLILTDYFTKFVDLFPLKDKTATAISQCIRSFICRWGTPQNLIANCQTELVNQVNAELAQWFCIENMVTKKSHPQLHGLNARTNQTLNTRLSKLVNDTQDDWDEILEGVAFSMRTQRQASTKYSPFFLMFNRIARLPIEIRESRGLDRYDFNITEADEEEYVADTMKNMAVVHEKVHHNMEAAREKQGRNIVKQESPDLDLDIIV